MHEMIEGFLAFCNLNPNNCMSFILYWQLKWTWVKCLHYIVCPPQYVQQRFYAATGRVKRRCKQWGISLRQRGLFRSSWLKTIWLKFVATALFARLCFQPSVGRPSLHCSVVARRFKKLRSTRLGSAHPPLLLWLNPTAPMPSSSSFFFRIIDLSEQFYQQVLLQVVELCAPSVRAPSSVARFDSLSISRICRALGNFAYELCVISMGCRGHMKFLSSHCEILTTQIT